MFKKFLMKKMLKSRAGDIPEGELDKILDIVEKNPALFQTIASEIQKEMSHGKDQTAAMLEVIKKHEEELKNLEK